MSEKNDLSNSNVTSTTPDFALKRKIGTDVSIRDAFDEDVIASAESVIEESKQDFFGDALRDIESMETSYSEATKTPEDSKKHVKAIQQHAFSMKGQSETLGFELMAHASKSLYDFCAKHYRANDAEQLIVVRKHLDTIHLIVKEKMQGDGGAIGHELVRSLHLLIQKYQ